MLDHAAVEEALAADADEALALLADLAGATDTRLRQLARRLAGRIVVEVGRSGRARTSGVGRLEVSPATAGADIDLDASSDALIDATAHRRPVSLDDLRARSWARPRGALCLLVDRSGSMGGKRLATAAVAAAATAYRAGTDYSVMVFSDDVVVLKAQQEDRPVEAVVDDLLALRGHGTTNLALALTEARAQLDRSGAPARDRVVVLLSDGRPTVGDDPLRAACAIERLAIVAPRGDSDDAAGLAAASGALLAEIGGPSEVPGALATLLGR